MSTPTPNQAEKWYQEQVVAVLYSNIKGAILGSTINIALVTFVLWSIFPTAGLIAWFLFGQFLNLIRLFVFFRYDKDVAAHKAGATKNATSEEAARSARPHVAAIAHLHISSTKRRRRG